MGSSSSLTVGLLNALWSYRGMQVPAEQLARDACRIEIDVLGKPIGKQDQYIAAYGGLRSFRFLPDDRVETKELPLTDYQVGNLEHSLLLFYTGITRSANPILTTQQARAHQNRDALVQMRDQAVELESKLPSGNPFPLGDVIQRGWDLKRGLAPGITSSQIDGYVAQAREAGAWGVKLAGAGSGGFLVVCARPSHHPEIREALGELQEFPFRFSPRGSQVVFRG